MMTFNEVAWLMCLATVLFPVAVAMSVFLATDTYYTVWLKHAFKVHEIAQKLKGNDDGAKD